MTDKLTQQDAGNSNMSTAPDEWVTGNEPMTGAQRYYLKTLQTNHTSRSTSTLPKRKHQNESTNCSA